MNPKKKYSLRLNANSVQVWKDGAYVESLSAKELYELINFKKLTLTKAQLIQETAAQVTNESATTYTKGSNG